jgi:branched-chain amino acid transport system ATP-binding protein
MPDPLLILEDIQASYVKKEILRGVSFEVMPGEMLALLGGNGSGKSTTLKVIAGVLPPSKGRVIFRGKDITHATPHQRQKLGIGYLLQGGRVFPNLTVAENLRISHSHARDGAHDNRPSPAIGSLFPELAERQTTRAGLLSGGQRQMLAIEMVLAQRPILTLLDEPCAALSPELGSQLLHRIKEQAGESEAFLVVEQNTESARLASKRVLQLTDGKTETSN